MHCTIAWDQVVMPNKALLASIHDHRSCQRRAADYISSLFRQVQYWAFFLIRQRTCCYAHSVDQPRQWVHGSRGLCILVHGLRSHPAAWHSQVSILRKNPEVDLFVPCVPHKGLCSLEEATQAILPTILDYAQKNPGKPVCIAGISNGSRIALRLSVLLQTEAPSTPVKVSTIAGVHFGSSRMRLLERFGIAACFYPKILREELTFGSAKAKKLLEDVLAPLPEGVAPRSYEFYAASEDLTVPDLGSSLPRLNKGEKIHILQGHSHDSIVAAVAQQQVASCLQWIAEYND